MLKSFEFYSKLWRWIITFTGLEFIDYIQNEIFFGSVTQGLNWDKIKDWHYYGKNNMP